MYNINIIYTISMPYIDIYRLDLPFMLRSLVDDHDSINVNDGSRKCQIPRSGSTIKTMKNAYQNSRPVNMRITVQKMYDDGCKDKSG